MMKRSILVRAESIPYSGYHGFSPESYLFGSEFICDQGRSSSFPLLTSQNKCKFLKIKRGVFIVRPFRIEKFGQIYINPQELLIDLGKIKSGKYLVIAVHNFQVEDFNPNLRECLAGIFLAKQVDDEWEEAEGHAIECRTIEILACIDKKTGRYFTHDYK